MKTGIISIMTALLAANICVGDPAPNNLVGYVIFADQTLSGRGTDIVTFDAAYTYFGSGDPREPYLYQKLDPNRFRVTNFDPDNPTVAWSHLLCTITNLTTGTIVDEDDGEMKGTFELFAPSAAVLDLAQSSPTNLVVGINSIPGQMLVLQQSTDLTLWSSVATNIAWTGHWEMTLPIAPSGRTFFRAYVPTE